MPDRYVRRCKRVPAPSRARRSWRYLSAEFLTGPHLGNNLLCLGHLGRGARSAGDSATTSTTLLEQEEEPGLGNGGLGRLAACYMDSLATLECRPSATASATSSASSTRPSATAGRSSSPTSGCASATRGNRASGDRLRRRLRRHTEATATRQGRDRVRWIPARYVGRRLRHAGPRLPGPTPTCSGCGRRRRPSRSTSRRSTSATTTAPSTRRCVGNHHEGALSERRAGGRQAAAPPQQYFFVSCSLQDMIRAPPAAGSALDGSSRCGAAQRHASVDRRRRTDAAAGRRARDRRGKGLGDHRSGRSPTRTTRCCPRRSRSGRCRSSARCCRAISRSSTRSTGASSRRCAAVSRATRRCCARLSIIDEAARRTCAWRTWPASAAMPSTAWRRCTPICSSRPCCATSTRCAGEVPQHDQRRDAAALDRAEQSRAERAHHQAIGDGWIADLEDRDRAARAVRRRCRLPGGMARRQARRTSAPGCADRASVLASWSIRNRSSTSR